MAFFVGYKLSSVKFDGYKVCRLKCSSLLTDENLTDKVTTKSNLDPRALFSSREKPQ